MKTAISLPDPIFEEAEQFAKSNGMSRSELYVKAIEAYLDKHRREEMTKLLNDFYDKEDSSLDPILMKMQVLSLQEDDWK